MRFTFLLLVAIVGTGLLVGCQPAAEEAAEPDVAMESEKSDEDLLAEQLDMFVSAWSEGDAAGLAALFTEDGDSVGPDGVRFQGRAAVESRYQEMLEGMYQGTEVTIDTTSTTFPSMDTAIVHGSYQIHGVKNADGDDVEIEGLYMNVAVKRDGAWKIHSSRVMLPLPAPAGT